MGTMRLSSRLCCWLRPCHQAAALLMAGIFHQLASGIMRGQTCRVPQTGCLQQREPMLHEEDSLGSSKTYQLSKDFDGLHILPHCHINTKRRQSDWYTPTRYSTRTVGFGPDQSSKRSLAKQGSRPWRLPKGLWYTEYMYVHIYIYMYAYRHTIYPSTYHILL